MKKFFTLTALLASAALMSAQGVYQIPNADFEGEWKKQTRKKYTEETPTNWNSFYSAETNSTTDMAFGTFLTGAQCGKLSKAPSAHSGTGAALITAVKNFTGTISNGNLTTGIIHMGSATPDNPENYNFSQMESENGACKFSGLPDAVSFWAMFDSKDTSKGNASANTVLHTDYGYRDPSTSMGVENEAAARIAKAYTEVTPDLNWKEYVVPFEYNENNLYQTYKDQKYILLSFSTNKVPGKGSDGDALAIDDIKFLYYSELAELSYDGVSVFEEGKTAYEIDALYDEAKLVCASNGKGASVTKTFDEENALLTIRIEGNDISVNPENVHTYTVQFKKPEPVITEYENDLLVALNGQGMVPQKTKIQLIEELDGTKSLALNNFMLGSGDASTIFVGNIKLTNLEIVDGKIETTQKISITAGDNPEDAEWMGPTLGEIPVTLNATFLDNGKMEATIDIPIYPGFMVVKVTFGETQSYNDGEAMNLKPGFSIVAYNRTFDEGWSTICLPFATSVDAYGSEDAVKVQEFVGVDDSGLIFKEVTELKANTPYLIYFREARENPFFFGTIVEEAAPVEVVQDEYTFCGSYEASASLAGKYDLTVVNKNHYIAPAEESAVLLASRAFFVKDGEQVDFVPVNLEGVATGIGKIEDAATQTYNVFTLTGVQVRKNATTLNGLQKGIYIVNGKKTVIK